MGLSVTYLRPVVAWALWVRVAGRVCITCSELSRVPHLLCCDAVLAALCRFCCCSPLSPRWPQSPSCHRRVQQAAWHQQQQPQQQQWVAPATGFQQQLGRTAVLLRLLRSMRRLSRLGRSLLLWASCSRARRLSGGWACVVVTSNSSSSRYPLALTPAVNPCLSLPVPDRLTVETLYLWSALSHPQHTDVILAFARVARNCTCLQVLPLTTCTHSLASPWPHRLTEEDFKYVIYSKHVYPSHHHHLVVQCSKILPPSRTHSVTDCLSTPAPVTGWLRRTLSALRCHAPPSLLPLLHLIDSQTRCLRITLPHSCLTG